MDIYLIDILIICIYIYISIALFGQTSSSKKVLFGILEKLDEKIVIVK